tara:strand:+ start:292 stop:702 length:411 start_codon:yes stop_codon:yes gene_type:complete
MEGDITDNYQPILWAELNHTVLKQKIPYAQEFQDTVAKALSIEQLSNWSSSSIEGDVSQDFIDGFNHGKLYVSEALINYLRTNWPDLVEEDVTVTLESETNPYLELDMPEWFTWSDPDGGETIQLKEDNVVPLIWK